jgi:hypothetical protein
VLPGRRSAFIRVLHHAGLPAHALLVDVPAAAGSTDQRPVYWINGDNVEDRMGHGRYWSSTCCAAPGEIAQTLVNPASCVPTITGSGDRRRHGRYSCSIRTRAYWRFIALHLHRDRQDRPSTSSLLVPDSVIPRRRIDRAHLGRPGRDRVQAHVAGFVVSLAVCSNLPPAEQAQVGGGWGRGR